MTRHGGKRPKCACVAFYHIFVFIWLLIWINSSHFSWAVLSSPCLSKVLTSRETLALHFMPRHFVLSDSQDDRLTHFHTFGSIRRQQTVKMAKTDQGVVLTGTGRAFATLAANLAALCSHPDGRCVSMSWRCISSAFIWRWTISNAVWMRSFNLIGWGGTLGHHGAHGKSEYCCCSAH